MATQRTCALAGGYRLRRINCASRKLPSFPSAVLWIVLSTLFTPLVSAPAHADPDPCSTDGTAATCSGDQSAGVVSGIDFASPPVTTLNVNSLSGPIAPVTLASTGIYFYNGSGQNVTVNSGNIDDIIAIDMTAAGAIAGGIIAISQGIPDNPSKDNYLGIPIPGTPETSGGVVTVNNYGDITTTGLWSHGIYSQSFTTGYRPSVQADLEAFRAQYETDGAGVSYAVSAVGTADNRAGVGSGVTGGLQYFVPQLSCDPLADPDCRLDESAKVATSGSGGTFTIDADGNFDFAPDSDFDALAVGDSYITSIDFWLSGSRAGSTQDGIPAQLVARVTKTDSGFDIVYQTIFDTSGFDYGSHAVSPATGAVFPDLGAYAQRLIDSLSGGGSGNSVTINHLDGDIVTNGFQSHGLFGESYGLNGVHGNNGGGFFSFGSDEPTAGTPGWAGGAVTITAEGAITTNADQSLGALGYSHGGNGGTGGSGGTWYGGRVGGQGGSGGIIEVFGSGTIDTNGVSSSGILALSEGGTGGLGGDGGFAAGGARGGHGGVGGDVLIDGSWTITTQNDLAHGIWGKSVGGNAGPGGDGGWLAGSAAGGGVGAAGGDVIIRSGNRVETFGDGAFGLYAESVGGFGGAGGTGNSIFASRGGAGNAAGSGGEVMVTNLADGNVITHGVSSHAIVAQSIGGGGGSGGSAGGIVGLGGSGGSGGNGGDVTVENLGLVETFNLNSRGVFAQSIGGGGGDGGFGGGIVGIGGSAGGISHGGSVTILNANQILTHGQAADAVYAQSVGGGGGTGGSSGGFVSIGGAGGGGGDGGDVGVGNDGLIATEGFLSRGVFAQSVGGGGGDGGTSVGYVSLGGKGGTAGSGGDVMVDNSGQITTDGIMAQGVYVQSVGGGGGSGGLSAGLVSLGGDGAAGSNGGLVGLLNTGRIETIGMFSQGVFAQSVGGGGGSGGGSLGWLASLGGDGGSGGIGGDVDISNEGMISTSGLASQAIFAQSVGGGGGNSGFTAGFFAAIGGDAGNGSLGGDVGVDNSGALLTSDDYSIGLFAQSVGGGGGNGAGSGGWFASLGGRGGTGGHGGIVDVLNANDGLIMTEGDWSHSIFAQSIGGGGGNGGGSGGVWVSIGGAAGSAGNGGDVLVNNEGELVTLGLGARGIHAQSIGGGGGSGGGSGALNIAIGGEGGSGGVGGDVGVTNTGSILTGGDMAEGIFAQSIGGSGGSGGSTGSMFVTVGGDGGDGNDGGIIDILNSGLITTLGHNAAGVFAQSVGGGGGNGGSATSIQIAAPVSVTVAVGGDGGDGGDGGSVSIENTGSVYTEGVNSDGVFAQSIGGSGGNGGRATTASVVFPVEIEGVEIPAMTVNVAVGGRGATGGQAGTVDAVNSGDIETAGFLSNGIFAQSIGGSGGRGGDATNVQIAYDASFQGSVAIGGDGGAGGMGNTVTVDNSGLIYTHSAFSNGVFAQSVGGGGGLGGDATTVSISISPPPTAPSDFIPTPSSSFHLAIGGDGGAGGIGGNIDVKNDGTIITQGHFSTGVMAQSVGGSGGAGGDARVISVELTADPLDFVPLLDLMNFDTTLVFGGDGGNGGQGGDVTIANNSDIATGGAFAHGIVAQSVGGNGGSGGSAVTFEFSNADVVPEVPVLDDISDLTTIEMTLQGSGGAGGDGGDINLESNGNIWTEGDFAMGVVAQTVGGGGGLAGFYNPHGITNSEIFNTAFNILVDTEAGLSFAGSAGGPGTAGDIIVTHAGDIQTLGDGAHGLFAQSAAAQGAAGNIDVTLDGNIYALGDHAFGIYAQSGGGGGNGDITLTLNDGVVMGGSGMGAGVYVAAGAENSIWNEGLVTSVPGIQGYAIRTTGGNEFIENYGTITGSIGLGAGENSMVNYGLIDAGVDYDLGLNGSLLNGGDFSPGGVMNIFTTNLSGNFEQASTGTMWFDVDFGYGLDTTDWLDINGNASLDGTLSLVLNDTGEIMPGEWERVLITSSNGITDDGLMLETPGSAVVGFELFAKSPTEQALRYSVDFDTQGLTRNQSAMGEHINAIQLAGGSELMKPLTASLVALPDSATLGMAYDMLSPNIYAANQLSRLFASLDFERSMHSCPVRDGDMRFSREGECNWIRVANRDMEYAADNGNLAGTDSARGMNMGLQRALTANWHFGAAVGFETSEYKIPLAAERDGSLVQLGTIFKGRFGRNAYNLSLTAGRGDYETERFTSLPGDGDFTVGSRELRFTSAHAGYGYMYERSNWYLQPALDVGFTTVNGDNFYESGAGAAALIVKGTDEDFATSRIDLLYGGEFASDNKRIYRPYIRAAYTLILSGTTGEISARLAGAPEGVPYFTQDLPLDDNFTNVSVGLDVLAGENWMLRFAYDRQFATSWDGESFFAKVLYTM